MRSEAHRSISHNKPSVLSDKVNTGINEVLNAEPKQVTRWQYFLFSLLIIVNKTESLNLCATISLKNRQLGFHLFLKIHEMI